jgi:uncharacterized OsmC-like protein
VTRNGVHTKQLYGTLDALTAQPELGRFRFHAVNHWVDGAHSRTTVQPFFGAGQEDTSRGRDFVLEAGEPGFLLGDDTGPSPMEALLHALAACLTTSVVYIAAARKVQLTEVTSALEGDIDLGGCFGLSDDVRNGFSAIRVTFTVKGDAPESKLREIVARAQERSAVYDVLTGGVPVEIRADIG